MIDLLLSEYSGYTKKTLLREFTFEEAYLLAEKISKRKHMNFAGIANITYRATGSAFAGVMAAKPAGRERVFQSFRRFVNSLTQEPVKIKDVRKIIEEQKEKDKEL